MSSNGKRKKQLMKHPGEEIEPYRNGIPLIAAH
jgi:hypothetical protein